MKLETQIKLDRFLPRPYQLPIMDAIENKGYKRVLAILPRRAGKDITAWNLMIRQAVKRVGIYWYILPTYSQARKVIWDSMDNRGNTFLSYIPTELLESTNEQLMRIKFKNGSMIQLIGSENYDSLVGTNARGCVFSEYALQDPRAYQFIRPILTAIDGWAIFLSTPRGKNHLWELWNIAQQNPSWFAYKMTVADTLHIPLEEIERERKSGEISEDLILQEYFCSFEQGVEGSYYSKYMDKMRIENRISDVPWEPHLKVHTAWDIGVRDATSIIFFQIAGQTIRIIDCYEKTKEGLEHYAKIIQSKPYVYGKHIGPHDLKVTEFGSGITRIEKARQLGINFTIADDALIIDGIEAVRSNLGKVWIDQRSCSNLIKALENYRQEFDIKKRVYKSQPLHDWSSHFADAMRYLCVSLSKLRDDVSPEDIDRRYREAMYGDASMPAMFRDDYKGYY